LTQNRVRAAQLIAIVASAVAIAAHAAPQCVGDCKGRGTVDVADLVLGVNIALGSMPVSTCQAFANAEGRVDVAQLVAGVNNALRGCAASRFLDNGDGTITDRHTNLTWEEKVGLGGGVDPTNLHAADNTYPWAGGCDTPDALCQTDAAAATACEHGAQGDLSACAAGCPMNDMGETPPCLLGAGATETLWDWLLELNAARFAGHADWRIPTVAELQSIVDYTSNNPAVDSAFHGSQCGPTCLDVANPACSCTQSQPRTELLAPYWSATAAVLPYPEWWFVSFGFGGAESGGNLGPPPSVPPWAGYVRAVRGGAAAPTPRFVDNGDSTITDAQTGLMWEQKVAAVVGGDPNDPHAVDNPYTFADHAWVGHHRGACTPCR
jgi:Protein of unknown function (DUF1566)